MTVNLDLALQLSDIADRLTMSHFRSSSLVIETKPDLTEVTIADRSTEEAIVRVVREARPEHAVLGEEGGVAGPPDAEWRWIFDPIDGTSNYVRGVPIWATLIGLQNVATGEVAVGVVSAPALGRRWWAEKGSGAYLNGEPIRVSAVARIEDAFVSWSDGHWPVSNHAEKRKRWQHVVERANRQRCLGDFWQHVLVAEGALDAACEPIVSVWDLAALVPIVEEAGGRFSDLDGRVGPAAGSALSTNGRLHEEILGVLRGGPG